MATVSLSHTWPQMGQFWLEISYFTALQSQISDRFQKTYHFLVSLALFVCFVIIQVRATRFAAFYLISRSRSGFPSGNYIFLFPHIDSSLIKK